MTNKAIECTYEETNEIRTETRGFHGFFVSERKQFLTFILIKYQKFIKNYLKEEKNYYQQ